MRQTKSQWEEVFSRYESSGLSQAAFCRQNGLLLKQFRYQWYERNKALKGQALAKDFEAVLLTTPSIPSLNRPTINLLIHLPNQIRCDVSVALNELSSLLKELVQAC